MVAGRIGGHLEALKLLPHKQSLIDSVSFIILRFLQLGLHLCFQQIQMLMKIPMQWAMMVKPLHQIWPEAKVMVYSDCLRLEC